MTFWGIILFEKLSSPYIGTSDKFKAVSKVRTHIHNIPVVYAKSGDNGIMYWAKENDFTVYKNVLSIIYNGAIAAGLVYAHRQNTGILAESYFIKLKNYDVDFKVNLFLQKVLEKTLYPKYSRDYLATWSGKVENDIIELPIKNDNIDFDFMKHFVSELEEERISKLQSYLKATGLKDYNLTSEEQKTIDEFKHIKWREFKLGDLFERINTNKLPFKASELPKESTDAYVLPCLTSSFQNQGLNYFAPKDNATILKNVISIPSNSDVYRAYFQSREFTILSDAYAIEWIYNDVKLSPNQYLFTVPCINKVTDLSIYSYKNKLGGWNVVQNKNIELPIKNNQPDYETMEILISAIKKLVIKDVVLYADSKMITTKKEVDNVNRYN